MESGQLSLWDNESLEKGYRLLSRLEFKEARNEFRKVTEGYIGEREGVKEALEATDFWDKILQNIDGHDQGKSLNLLLLLFKDYSFSSSLINLRASLLDFISEFMIKAGSPPEYSHVQDVFDLYLQKQDYSKADRFISDCLKKDPGSVKIKCLQARVQWEKKETEKAYKTYCNLLLNHPDKIEIEQIEIPELKNLVNSYGSALTPIYAFFRLNIPLPSLKEDLVIVNEAHHKAVEIYKTIKSADKAMKKQDKKETIRYRKELSQLSPEIFREYFNRLQRRR